MHITKRLSTNESVVQRRLIRDKKKLKWRAKNVKCLFQMLRYVRYVRYKSLDVKRNVCKKYIIKKRYDDE